MLYYICSQNSIVSKGALYKNLTAEQKKLVDEILEKESPQRKVDAIVADTKLQISLKSNEDMVDSNPR